MLDTEKNNANAVEAQNNDRTLSQKTGGKNNKEMKTTRKKTVDKGNRK